jgi:YD repeat-containing protein
MKLRGILRTILIIITATWIFYLGSTTYGEANSTVHTYDPMNRLIQTVITNGNKTTTINYEYDASGNMTVFTNTVETQLDLQTFASDFGRTDCSGGCSGDLDGDGVVDGLDLYQYIRDYY